MLELVLLLAQTCVAEIDLQERPDECPIMWEVNAYHAERRRISIAQQTREFNAYWKVEHTSRAWIGALALDPDAEPAGWPVERGRWARWAPRWAAYLQAATKYVGALPPSVAAPVCRYDGRPRRLAADTYGGTPDDGKHADDPKPCAQARRVRCLPGELQAYWNSAKCRLARRRSRPRAIPARIAAGR